MVMNKKPNENIQTSAMIIAGNMVDLFSFIFNLYLINQTISNNQDGYD